ncbi:hypothetical protein BH11MYX4_BH11MYX4_10970 [soil metagenome]
MIARLSLSTLRAIVRAVAIAGPPALSVACGGQTVGSNDDPPGADGTNGTRPGGASSSGGSYSQQNKSTMVPLQVECYAPDAGASDAGASDAASEGGATADGGTPNGGANGDAGLTCNPLSCDEQCGSTLDAGTPIWMWHLISCDLPKPGTTTGTVTCNWQSPPAGRRPSDVRVPAAVQARSEVGAYLAASAFLEEASIGAFLGLERELRAHGAPTSLTERARAAARDEARHTRVLGALARRAGATPTRARRQPRVIRDLETVAIENGVEGCVREAYGALVALWQSERASDPAIRSAMAEIAVDEARHAELALDSGAWMATLLDGGARARVEHAMRTAAQDLRAETETAPPPALVSTLGLPTSAEAGLLVDALASALLA